MADRKALTPAQKKTLALMPFGTALFVVGLVLVVVIESASVWPARFGWALLVAGIVLELAVLLRLLKLNKEDRS